MKILVVDDDTMLLKQLKCYLARRDYQVRTVQSAEAALKLIKETDFHPGVVVTDVRMGAMSGLDLVGHIHETDSEIFIIVMTGYGTIEMAVEAMRKGAFDFITKPFRTSVILEKLESIKAELELRRELQGPPSTEEAMPQLADAAGWLKPRAGELPMLLISPRPKKHFQKEWGLEGFEHLWLTNESHERALPPGHLYSLTSHIEAFTENHGTGLVYLEGLGRLTTLHQWEPIANLLGKLSTLVQEKGFHLCLGLAEEELDSTQRNRLQRQITDRLVLSVSRSLGHAARLAILNHLFSREKTNFNQMLSDLEFSNSASLSFHLKHMLQSGLIEHDTDGAYRLTSGGSSAVSALDQLRRTGLTNSEHHTTILTISDQMG